MRKLVLAVKLALTLCFLFTSTVFAQDKTVSGTVLSDDDGSPLIGVTVTNEKTKKRTLTNEAGYFSIAASKGDVLKFNYVGYSVREVTVSGDDKINLRIPRSEDDLGNVVVTGYGIKKGKKELTYQAITVSGEEIANTRRENFINSLAGRVPGATITSTTGMPGSSSSIILRGPTSIDGSNQPIFVVDGLIVDNSAFEMQDRLPASGGLNLANRSNDFTNRAADINPEDIESVTILKGPEATALYGSDGANGAIIITTKKGKKGKATISYNNSFRIEKVYRLPEIQTVFDQGTFGVTNGTVRSFFGQKIPANVPVFDNINNFFRNGFTQQHNLSVDGGSDVGTYRFNAGIVNQEGVVPNTGYKRYAFRLNNTFKVSSKINLTTSATFTNTRTDKASKGSGGFLLSLLTWPVDDDASVYLDANGNRKTIRDSWATGAEDDNPHWDVNKNKSFDINNRFGGNVQISYDVTKWLNLSALTGIDYYTTTGTWYTHPQSNLARTVGGVLQQYRENQSLLNGAYKATIRKKTGNISNTIIAAFTFDSRKYQVNSVKGERVFDPNFLSINNTDPLTVASITTAENFNRFGTFINYVGSYKNWLNVSLSGRLDASSRLVDPLNYDFSSASYMYWSAGTSFIVSDAFKLPKAINFAKARINYATTGRDPRTPYVKANRFSTSTFTGGGLTPFVTQGNPALKPEFSKQFEVGFEMKFLKNRIGIDFAYYDNRTSDQLINPRISYASGAILQWLNGGTATNRGFEFQLTASPYKRKNFTWDVTVNFARNRNEILEMPVGLPTFYNSDTWIANIRNISVKGGSAFQLAANRFLRNTNGDLIISATTGLPLIVADYTPVADRQPDFTMGLVNSFTIHKNLNISFNLDIRRGGDVYNGTAEFLHTRGMSTRTLDRETPRVIRGVLNDGLQNTANPTPNNIVITPLFRSDYYTTVAAEDFIERDVHWVRMRDLTLAYNLPSKLIKRQRLVKSASVFVTGTDLFIITNYSGADPSANANNVSSRGGIGGVGMDFGNLANPRGINFGVKAQF
jgi:TonB-linked SusC/RagA family outer membrane protein